MSLREEAVKVVVAGDGMVGKTSLISAFCNNNLPGHYSPTSKSECCCHRASVTIECETISVEIWDTSLTDYDRNLYPQTDIFLLCFSTAHPVSLENIKVQWVYEIYRICPNAKILLVGTKIDLRADHNAIMQNNPAEISEVEGIMAAAKMNLCGYVECSSVMRQGLAQVFEAAVKAVIYPANREKCYSRSSCIIS